MPSGSMLKCNHILHFLGDPDKLYVNTVPTSKLLRLDLAKDGKSTKVTELKLSRPLQGPDGMRAIDGRRLIAEGNGLTAIGVPNMESKLRQRDAKNPNADKGPFGLFLVSIPH